MKNLKICSKSNMRCYFLFFISLAFMLTVVCTTVFALEVGDVIYQKVDAQCFKIEVITVNPVQVKFEESDLCTTLEDKDTLYDEGTCYNIVTEQTTPVSLKLEETELSECINTIYYKLVGDVCFKIEVLDLVPDEKIKMSEVSKDKCQAPAGNNDDDSGSGAGGNGGGGGGGNKKKSSSTATTTSSKTPTPLYDDAACKKKLKKQPCVMAYRTYSCESFNVDGKFKEYKEECASCNNKMKDFNENGIDCGGVCTTKCAAVVTAPPVQAEASDEPAVTTEPTGKQEQGPTQTEASSVFSKWLIPILAGLIFFAIILGVVLWLMLRSKPTETAATDASSASSKGSTASVSALSASSEPKIGKVAKVKATAKAKSKKKPKKAAKVRKS